MTRPVHRKLANLQTCKKNTRLAPRSQLTALLWEEEEAKERGNKSILVALKENGQVNFEQSIKVARHFFRPKSTVEL